MNDPQFTFEAIAFLEPNEVYEIALAFHDGQSKRIRCPKELSDLIFQHFSDEISEALAEADTERWESQAEARWEMDSDR